MTRRAKVCSGIALAVASLLLLFAAGPRYRLASYTPRPIALPPGDLEALDPWLAHNEAGVPALRPELAKGIRWADPARKSRTGLVLLYLHGFSASRREISPVVEDLGAALHANVFFTRLRGHGQDAEALGQVRGGDWFNDAEEALAIGRRLGDRVVLIGTSTGGTLATWLAARTPDLHALILLSPNFGLKDPASRVLLWPWGRPIARLLVGEYRSWKPSSELHGRWWTTRYRVEGLLPMMALVDHVAGIDLSAIHAPALVLYSQADEVLDTRRIVGRFSELGSGKKLLVVVPGTTHVLAGDAVNPGATPVVEKHVLEFLAEVQEGRR